MEASLFAKCDFVLNGGKPDSFDCKNGDCNCYEEGATGCLYGICVCTHEGHLVFEHRKCIGIEHSSPYDNMTLAELQCPRTCSANHSGNSCIYGTKGSDGKCYCHDGTPVKPLFKEDLSFDFNAILCPDPPVTTSTPTTSTPLSWVGIQISIVAVLSG